MHKFIDYTGVVFKNIRVVDRAETKITTNKNGCKRKTNRWNCICSCGRNLIRDARSIKYDKQCKVCANFFIKNSLIKLTPSQKSNNKIRNRLKTIWTGMNNRCYNKKNINYKYYGLKGIGICDDWRNDFNSFKVWAFENGYKDDLSLDRKNGEFNYEPKNCRWVTRLEQQNNLANNRLYDFNGEMLTAPEIGRRNNISITKMYGRLQKGKSVDEAIRMGS